VPTFKKANFQLLNGETFSIMYNVSDLEIKLAFESWQGKYSTNPTVKDFIDYVNRGGVVHAITIEAYNVFTDAEEITETSLMPFGRYKNKYMVNIPAYYLLLIYDKGWVHHNGVKKYIIENMQALRKEAGRN